MDGIKEHSNSTNQALGVCYNNQKSTKAQRVYTRAYQDAEQIGKAKPRKPGEEAKQVCINRRAVEDYLEQKRLERELSFFD
mgnify:CR=1 FL=1